MTATLQLYLALGFGRLALLVDLVLTAAVVATVAIVMIRSRRPQPAGPPVSAVVAEAEAVVAEARHHERA